MRYSIKKNDSNRKRYVRAREFSCALSSCGGGGTNEVTLSLTLDDPRTDVGEGKTMHVAMSMADINEPLTVKLLARMYAMLDARSRATFDATVAEMSK